jgi:hypothetical protein
LYCFVFSLVLHFVPFFLICFYNNESIYHTLSNWLIKIIKQKWNIHFATVNVIVFTYSLAIFIYLTRVTTLLLLINFRVNFLIDYWTSMFIHIWSLNFYLLIFSHWTLIFIHIWSLTLVFSSKNNWNEVIFIVKTNWNKIIFIFSLVF